MVNLWLRDFLWRPFESMCRIRPVAPIRIKAMEPCENIKCLKFENIGLKFLSWFSGGYNYPVVYIIDDEIMFDSGFAWARRPLCSYLVKNGLTTKIKAVINSHTHEDHIGNNHALRKLCGCDIYIHPKGLDNIKFLKNKEFFRHFLFGTPPYFEALACLDAVHTKNFKFEMIPTPGHTQDHVCLYEKDKKILLSGDLFLGEFVSSQLSEVSGPDWIRSLEQVLALEVELLLDGHGVFIKGKGRVREALTEKLTFLRYVQCKVSEYSKEEKSIQKITQKVFSDRNFVNLISFHEGWMSVITKGSFSRSNLVESFLKEHDPRIN